MSTTHTHVITTFANPFLRCDECGQSVEGVVALVGNPTGCNHICDNVPCGHRGSTSSCPSWSPVDGCRCQEHLGHVPHPAANGRPSDG